MKPSLRISELFGALEDELNKSRLYPLNRDDPRVIMLLFRALVEYLDEQHAKQRDDSKSLIQ